MIVPPPTDLNAKTDGTYRTKCSGVPTRSQIYEDTDHNLAVAMMRMLKCRGDSLATETMYRDNQRVWMQSHIHLFEYIAALNTPYFAEWKGAVQEALDHYDDPHPKRELRIQAMEELKAGEVAGDFAGLFDRMYLYAVKYKLKKGEIAKGVPLGAVRKPPRTIGDLGVPASLQGFRLTEVLKYATSNTDYCVHGCRMHFVKAPNEAELTRAFKSLLAPHERSHFVYFSDDSCLSVVTTREATENGIVIPIGSTRIYNLDIKSCDSSHTQHLFEAFAQTIPLNARDDVQVLIDQCKLPIKLTFRDGVSKLVLQPIDEFGAASPRLYSGSTITTTINNLACVCIAYSIAELGAETPGEIKAAAAAVGYVLSIDECHDYSDIQFLKTSPAYDTKGTLRPLLNLGVLLRSYGTCHGDLPGKASLRSRHAAFQSALISGMYPNIHFPLVHEMRRTHTPGTTELRNKMLDRSHKYQASGEEYSFTSAEVYRRYRLTDLEMLELDVELGRLDYGCYFTSPGAEKILLKDYDLYVNTDWLDHDPNLAYSEQPFRLD